MKKERLSHKVGAAAAESLLDETVPVLGTEVLTPQIPRCSEFGGAAAGIQKRGSALRSLGFFGIQLLIRFGKQLFDPLPIAAVYRKADARGDARRLIVVGHHLADTIDDAAGFVFLRFRKDQGKLVSAISGGSINGAAVNAQNIGDATNGAAADKMPVTIVDGLQTIEVEKQDGKRAPGAVGTLGFVF